MEKICSNPECKKVHNEIHDNYCSFDCWESVNCKFPTKPEFEEFAFIGNIVPQA